MAGKKGDGQRSRTTISPKRFKFLPDRWTPARVVRGVFASIFGLLSTATVIAILLNLLELIFKSSGLAAIRLGLWTFALMFPVGVTIALLNFSNDDEWKTTGRLLYIPGFFFMGLTLLLLPALNPNGEFQKRFQEVLAEKKNPNKRVAIHLNKMPTGMNAQSLRRWFSNNSPSPINQSHVETRGEAVYVEIAPVEDIEALAARITFGETKVDRDESIMNIVVDDQAILAETEPTRDSETTVRPKLGERTTQRPFDPPLVDLPRPRSPRPDPPTKHERRLQPTDDASLVKLINALTRGNPRNKREAVEYLEKHEPKPGQNEKIAPLLEKLLEDADAWSWPPAPKAFMIWMTSEQVPVLVKLADHPDHWVRSDAIKTLGDYPDKRAAAALAAALNTDRFDARDSLKRMGTVAEPAMIKLLESGNREEKDAACEILRFIGTKECVPALEKVARSGDFGLKNDAERTLEIVAEY